VTSGWYDFFGAEKKRLSDHDLGGEHFSFADRLNLFLAAVSSRKGRYF